MTVKSNIVRCGEDPSQFSVEEIGGKGLNLLRLYNAAQKLGTFSVPEFFIIPTGVGYSTQTDKHSFTGSPLLKFDAEEIERIYNEMFGVDGGNCKYHKTAAVRSSSPLEDGVKATFAGMFLSRLNNNNFKKVLESCSAVYDSAVSPMVKDHAKQMGVEYTGLMAVVVQEEIRDPFFHGTIQIDKEGFTLEGALGNLFFDSNRFLVEPFTRKHADLEGNEKELVIPEMMQSEYFMGNAEALDIYYRAMEAIKELGLIGIVQLEVCYEKNLDYSQCEVKNEDGSTSIMISGGKGPKLVPKTNFVQIRQLPEISSDLEFSHISIPEGVPYIKSNRTNGVQGELHLPAYVTVSESGLSRLLIVNGYDSLGIPRDDRAAAFEKRSKLAHNFDFNQAKGVLSLRRMGLLDVMEHHDCFSEIWSLGNDQFPSGYILVCDKLDESVAAMARVTTNKKAIITTGSYDITNHAMTVARELRIPCMAVNHEMDNLDSFYHNVETGDMLHFKCYGGTAIAYVEKRVRE